MFVRCQCGFRTAQAQAQAQAHLRRRGGVGSRRRGPEPGEHRDRTRVMKITVVGTGYLGATHAACLASLGHDVLGVDTDPATVETLNRGTARFREPGLDDLLRDGVATGRLRFTTSWAVAAAHARVHFLCVGTPQRPDSWALDTSTLDAVVDSLVPLLTGEHLLIGKSTVPVGTARRLQEQADRLSPADRSGQSQVRVSWNPEFLREGQAVADTLHPDRIVLGVADPGSAAAQAAERTLREIYASALETSPLVVTDLQTAEMVKVAANAFLATKISFINVVADVCEAAGADVNTVSGALGLDPRIGRDGLRAGLGYGGGCLPKDLRGFAARAAELGVEDAAALFGLVDSVNLRRRDVLVEQAVAAVGGSASGHRITVLGAAFKPGSDDVRDSPALAVATALSDAGAQVTVHDPVALDNAHARAPQLTCAADLAEAVDGAELVVVATEWPLYRDMDPVEFRALVHSPVIIDGRNCLSAGRWTAAGWDYRGIGWRNARP